MWCAIAFLAITAWEAGASRRDITPRQAMWMAGYAGRTAPASGTESPLCARAVALRCADSPRVRAVTVSLDLVGIDAELAARVKKALADRHGLAEAEVALACSHTHCGPVVGSTLRSMYPLDDGMRERSRAYADFLVGEIDMAVGEALSRLKPCALSWHEGNCGFAVNRRANKEAEVVGIRQAGKPLAGPVDHRVPAIAARTPEGRLIAVLFGYACHATTLSFDKWCADYPGFASEALEKSNPGAVCAFIAGCGADQNPLPRRTVALAKAYGDQLAESVSAALSRPGKALGAQLSVALVRAPLPLEPAPSKDELEKQASGKEKYIASRARNLLADMAAGKALPVDYAFPVQAWRLGDHTLVFLGGEVVVDYSLRMGREITSPAWVAAYSNDVMAYIPSRRVLKEGGYEGASSMIYYGLPASWREGVEETLVDAVREAARRVGATVSSR